MLSSKVSRLGSNPRCRPCASAPTNTPRPLFSAFQALDSNGGQDTPQPQTYSERKSANFRGFSGQVLNLLEGDSYRALLFMDAGSLEPEGI